MFLRRLRKRRRNLKQEIQRLQDRRERIITKTLDAIQDASDDIACPINKNSGLTFNPSLSLDFKTFNNEPFGWPKGTVRGILTLWICLSTCLGFLLDRIPVEFFLMISSAVILSYFVNRASNMKV